MEVSSQIGKLLEIKKLYEQGILTKEEMEAEKQKILGTAPPTTKSIPHETKELVKEIETYDNITAIDSELEEDEEESFFKRNKLLIILCIVAGVIGIYFLFSKVILPSNDADKEHETLAIERNREPIGIKGMINGKIGFTMHLTFNGSEIVGTEHYDNQPSDAIIKIKGNVDDNGNMTLVEYDGGSVSGKFVGTLYAKDYSGVFTQKTGNSMNFTATVMDEQTLEQMEANERLLETKETKYEKHERGVNVEIIADYPIKANPKLLQSTQKYINEVIATAFQVETKRGDLNDNQAVINFLGNEKSQDLMKEKNTDESPDEVQYEENVMVEKCFENEKCVSYRASSFYCHGGVGNWFCVGATFRKADGKQIKIIKNPQNSAFKALLIRAVRNKLGEDYEIVSEFKGDFEDNPMPGELPLMANDGVEFNYQHYEIGPGSFGQISVTIPYSQIMEYMTNEATNLIK